MAGKNNATNLDLCRNGSGENWGSRIGVILAVAGSAVGLGNFLRFPGQAALNGGGVFNSGILATGPVTGANFDYAPASDDVLKRVAAMEKVAADGGYPLAAAALSEMRRVTAPGGKIVIAEFSTPTWAPFRAVYREWIMATLPALARPFSSNPRAYDYLAESILAWPDQEKLAGLLSAVSRFSSAW